MDNQEIIEALRVANHELVVAEEAVKAANFKVQAALSQLQQNLSNSGNIAGLTVHSAPREIAPQPAAAPAVSVQATQSQRLPSADPAPGSGMRAPGPWDAIASSTRSEVPQSTASRVDPATVIAERPVGPTPEQPQVEPAGRAGPTREVVPPTDRKAEQLGHFQGTGSLFARYFSPEIVTAGKGMLRPGRPDNLQQYAEDLRDLAPNEASAWPAGFYRNKVTSERQLQLQTPIGVVFVPSLKGENDSMPYVLLYPIAANHQWTRVDELELIELLRLKEATEGVLIQLSSQVLV